MRLFFLLAFILVPWSPGYLYAVTTEELQQLRYAKALQAYNQKDYPKASKFILQNMDIEKPHRDSLELLALIHEEKGDLLKAQKVYYYLVRKFYDGRILKLPIKNISHLRIFDKPDSKTQKDLLKIALIHLKLFEQFKLQKEVEKDYFEKRKIEGRMSRVLTHAKKYLLVLKHFKHEPENIIEYNLKLINKEINGNKKSNEHFKEDLSSEEEQEAPIQDLKSMIEDYVGESLIKADHKELVTKYFKSNNQNTKIESLQNYSRIYLDGLSSSDLAFSIGKTFGDNLNLLQLDQQNFAVASLNEFSRYGEFQLNTYYNSNQDNNWMYTISASVSELEYSNSNFRTADARTWKMATEFKFLNLPHSVQRLALATTLVESKRDNIAAWRPFSNKQYIGPYYDHYSKSGIFSFGLPFTRTSYQNVSDQTLATYLYLASLGYTPWTKSRFFTPTLTVQYGQTHSSNDDLISRSNNLRIYFSNQSNLSKRNILLFSLSYIEDEAEDIPDSYSLETYTISFINDLSKFIPGAVFDLSLAKAFLAREKILSIKDVDQTVLSAGLGFYF